MEDATEKKGDWARQLEGGGGRGRAVDGTRNGKERYLRMPEGVTRNGREGKGRSRRGPATARLWKENTTYCW